VKERRKNMKERVTEKGIRNKEKEKKLKKIIKKFLIKNYFLNCKS
jgi:hypothetical protein